jgi:hypothetical protein
LTNLNEKKITTVSTVDRLCRWNRVWIAATVPVPVAGYDLDSVQSSFGLDSEQVTALPVTVVDESTWPSLRVTAQVTAQITGSELRVHIEGRIEPGSTGELLADLALHGPTWRDTGATRLRVPGFVVEITDDTDFLLEKRSIDLHGTVTVDDGERRPARFAAGMRAACGLFAGTPAHVVLRIRDAADVRTL